MPSKSHRRASRQAQLRQKKRHGKAQPQQFDPGPTEPRPAAQAEEPVAEEPLQPESAPASASLSSPPQPVRRSMQRASAQPALAYIYLGSELRRIGILATLIVAILAVLTVLLRG